MMKKMVYKVMVMALAAVGALGTAHRAMAAVRVDVRDTAGYYIATGTEIVGTADGGEPIIWDTTQEPDGWTTLTSGGGSAGTPRPTVDVLVLNTSASVVGGRLSQSETWDDGRVVVVRDDIVVPSGATLTLGAGTLTFWWKANCEDDPDGENWDYLMFKVDGAEIARIDGDSGWRQVTVKIKSEGTHTLMWTYHKDYMDDDMTGIEDCGRVDQLAWTPAVGDSDVPVSWLENLGMVAAGASVVDAANADPDGDGLTTAQEYVAGTDPTDPDSTFTASIEIVDGQPVVTPMPDLLDDRTYKKFGKRNLDDPSEEWTEVKAGEEGNYNFFKVTVELP